MCRMFAYVGNSPKDLEILFNALIASAKYDDMSEDGKSHGDGWGCVILSDSKLTFHKSTKPIFEDDFVIPPVEGRTFAIFHARRASPNTPKDSPIFSHPFVSETANKVIYLAHNGTLQGEIPRGMVDSELALRTIVRHNGNIRESEAELIKMKREKSGINLLVLTIDKFDAGDAELNYLNSWNSHQKNDRFYEMFKGKMESGNAIFSSTLKSSIPGTLCERDKVGKL